HKRGLSSMTLRAEVQGELDVPKAQAGRDLSDLEFAWPPAAPHSQGLAFVRGGRVHIPNPDRLYGLYASGMDVAFTARAKPGDQRPWRWVVRVLDAKGQAVAQQESTSAAGVLAEGAAHFDLSDQPAGVYFADAKVWQE